MSLAWLTGILGPVGVGMPARMRSAVFSRGFLFMLRLATHGQLFSAITFREATRSVQVAGFVSTRRDIHALALADAAASKMTAAFIAFPMLDDGKVRRGLGSPDAVRCSDAAAARKVKRCRRRVSS